MWQQLLEFGLRHWDLVLAFVVILMLLLTFELHSKITGVPAVSPQQTVQLLNHNDALILDMRDGKNFSSGHILNSINISFQELDNNSNKLAKYKDKPVVLVYNVGQHHHKMAHKLKKNGFTDLYHLKGGIPAWQQAGLPLKK